MNNFSADYYIETLNMIPHVEGGYYKESFVSTDTIITNKSPDKDGTERPLWTSIYFLLRTGKVSNFHRLKSDEMWYFHSGNPLTIYIITPEGELITKKLGLNISKGETPQVLVPKNHIFGSAMNDDGFALVGCMVSPGFSFNDFELFKRSDLLNRYPEYNYIINKLTKE